MMKQPPMPVHAASGWSRWSVMFASAALLISVALLGADQLFLPDRFQIRQVELLSDGSNVKRASVDQAIHGLGRHSWFSIDLNAVEAVIQQVPWVYGVEVRRQWPAKLVVQVVEARPAARWNRDQWLNQRGELLVMPKDFGDTSLPWLQGPGQGEQQVMQTYQSIVTTLKDSNWQIEQLVLNSRDAWSLTLKIPADETRHLLKVQMGKSDPVERFRRFAMAFGNQSPEVVARIQSVDLRYSNGFAIAWRTAPPETKQIASDKTPENGMAAQKS